MKKPSILAILTRQEWDCFLPGETGDWLKSLPGFHTLDPTAPDFGDWEERLRAHKPDVLVTCWRTPPIPAALDHLPQYICHLTGTVRRLIPRDLIASGVLVTNWGSSISRTVAESALMLTLSALRQASHWAVAMHREGQWKTPESKNMSLFERRVGLHGFGAIAQNLVPLLRPFDVEIQTYSPSVSDELLANHGVKRADSLDDLFSWSQVLVELAGNTPQNFHIVNEDLLRRLPEDGVFVNVGRGAVVDEVALIKVAREGNLQVALDVYEKEPLPVDHPFRGMSNVTLMPHMGGPTIDRRRDAGRHAMANLKAFLENKPLTSVITAEIYDRAT